jgi:hypothetical protein
LIIDMAGVPLTGRYSHGAEDRSYQVMGEVLGKATKTTATASLGGRRSAEVINIAGYIQSAELHARTEQRIGRLLVG